MKRQSCYSGMDPVEEPRITSPRVRLTPWLNAETKPAHKYFDRGVKSVRGLAKALRRYELTKDEYAAVQSLVRHRMQQKAAYALGLGQRAMLRSLKSAYEKLGVRGQTGMLELTDRLVPRKRR